MTSLTVRHFFVKHIFRRREIPLIKYKYKQGDIFMVKFLKNKLTKEVRIVNDEELAKEDEIELKANSNDAAIEKHVPVVQINGNKVDVKVGSVPHPMSLEHHIAFIVLETNKGIKPSNLDPTSVAKTSFVLTEEEVPLRAYEYCNLHGLWVKEI